MAKNTRTVGTHAENPSAAEKPSPEVKAPEAPAAETPAPVAPAAETPAPEVKDTEAQAPVAETPAPEAPAAETPAPKAPKAEAKPKLKFSDAVVKRAAEVFKHHPTVDTIFFTSDNTAFLGAQFARMHAESLKDAVVTTVTRKEIE